MFSATTLTDLIESNRNAPRNITYVEGEQNERSVAFGDLYERALGILHSLQKLGAKRGDKLICSLPTTSSSSTLSGPLFWAESFPFQSRPVLATSTVVNSFASHASSESRSFTLIAARLSVEAFATQARASSVRGAKKPSVAGRPPRQHLGCRRLPRPAGRCGINPVLFRLDERA